jgi:hypothetical protein
MLLLQGQLALREATAGLQARRLLPRLLLVRVQPQAIQPQTHRMGRGSSSCSGLEAGRSRQDRRQSARDAAAAAIEQQQVAGVRLMLLHRSLRRHGSSVAVNAGTAHVIAICCLSTRGERVVRCTPTRRARSGRRAGFVPQKVGRVQPCHAACTGRST